MLSSFKAIIKYNIKNRNEPLPIGMVYKMNISLVKMKTIKLNIKMTSVLLVLYLQSKIIYKKK